jgi:hypothetical protein
MSLLLLYNQGYDSDQNALAWQVRDATPAPRRKIIPPSDTANVFQPAAAPLGWMIADDPFRVKRPLARLDETAFAVSPLVINPAIYLPVDEAPAQPRRRPIAIDGDTAWSVLLPIPPPPAEFLVFDQAISLRRRPTFDGDIAAIAFNVPPPLVNIGWLAADDTPKARRLPIWFDKDPAAGLIPVAATPSITGWGDQDRQAARARPGCPS